MIVISLKNNKKFRTGEGNTGNSQQETSTKKHNLVPFQHYLMNHKHIILIHQNQTEKAKILYYNQTQFNQWSYQKLAAHKGKTDNSQKIQPTARHVNSIA